MTKKSETIEEVKSQVIEQHIDPLTEKVGKCYSTERYEQFESAVEKIIGRYLKSVFGWAGLGWIASIIVSMLIQKFFKVL